MQALNLLLQLIVSLSVVREAFAATINLDNQSDLYGRGRTRESSASSRTS